MYSYAKIHPSCDPINPTPGDLDLNNLQFTLPKNAFTHIFFRKISSIYSSQIHLPMWPHSTPGDHSLDKMILQYLRMLPHKFQLFILIMASTYSQEP